MEPCYLSDLDHFSVQAYANTESSSMNLLVIRRTNTIRCGERAFCAAAPRLWNIDIRSSNSSDFFNKKLKKSLFTLQSQVNDRVHIRCRKCRRLLKHERRVTKGVGPWAHADDMSIIRERIQGSVIIWAIEKPLTEMCPSYVI